MPREINSCATTAGIRAARPSEAIRSGSCGWIRHGLVIVRRRDEIPRKAEADGYSGNKRYPPEAGTPTAGKPSDYFFFST